MLWNQGSTMCCNNVRQNINDLYVINESKTEAQWEDDQWECDVCEWVVKHNVGTHNYSHYHKKQTLQVYVSKVHFRVNVTFLAIYINRPYNMYVSKKYIHTTSLTSGAKSSIVGGK